MTHRPCTRCVPAPAESAAGAAAGEREPAAELLAGARLRRGLVRRQASKSEKVTIVTVELEHPATERGRYSVGRVELSPVRCSQKSGLRASFSPRRCGVTRLLSPPCVCVGGWVGVCCLRVCVCLCARAGGRKHNNTTAQAHDCVQLRHSRRPSGDLTLILSLRSSPSPFLSLAPSALTLLLHFPFPFISALSVSLFLLPLSAPPPPCTAPPFPSFPSRPLLPSPLPSLVPLPRSSTTHPDTTPTPEPAATEKQGGTARGEP